MESSIAKAIPSATAALVQSDPLPVSFPVAPPLLPEPTPTILAGSVLSPVPAAPVPLASPTPAPASPKEAPAPKYPEEEILSPPAPSRIAYKHGRRTKQEEATIISDTRDVAVAKTSNTKNTAVAKASTAWDRKEHSIDHQLNTVDRKIAKTGDNQEQANLKEHKKYLQQRKDYVRRSRTYHQNKTRLEWDKAHGTSMLVDSIRASLGF
jgi:type IV secretory pathway VirB10-like protein